ncbi:hypothetical protein PACTADRAFT_3761 [Pachysolen tannophilus NRRL Y-2460]|uniref:Uncharacterized protein n=1 Tax=Pachysolen tannophilus NRRL Y-2460 TaxID=669874 RepID=A0A1E4TSX0_PACTA|nr:hypothetical protein PACTADRAFT_3761 [Pachysolen tannophilus NRRL Y-2460]
MDSFRIVNDFTDDECKRLSKVIKHSLLDGMTIMIDASWLMVTDESTEYISQFKFVVLYALYLRVGSLEPSNLYEAVVLFANSIREVMHFFYNNPEMDKIYHEDIDAIINLLTGIPTSELLNITRERALKSLPRLRKLKLSDYYNYLEELYFYENDTNNFSNREEDEYELNSSGFQKIDDFSDTDSDKENISTSPIYNNDLTCFSLEKNNNREILGDITRSSKTNIIPPECTSNLGPPISFHEVTSNYDYLQKSSQIFQDSAQKSTSRSQDDFEIDWLVTKLANALRIP